MDDTNDKKLEEARTFLQEQKIFNHRPSKYEVVQYALKMLLKAVGKKQQELRIQREKSKVLKANG